MFGAGSAGETNSGGSGSESAAALYGCGWYSKMLEPSSVSGELRSHEAKKMKFNGSADLGGTFESEELSTNF